MRKWGGLVFPSQSLFYHNLFSSSSSPRSLPSLPSPPPTLIMLMVQKQPAFSLSQSPTMFHHRRHPSAPPAVVVVHPTRTPGLLSLSKPQQQRSQRQQRPAAKPTIVKHQLQTPVSAPESPSPAPRGRQPKDKASR